MAEEYRRSRTALTFAAVFAAAAVGYLVSHGRRLGTGRVDLEERPGTDLHEVRDVVDGVQMRWLEHGQGTPVVLIHGIPTSPELFRRIMPRLRHAKAYAWEMVGYGGSIAQGEGRYIGVERQAEYLAAWLRHMSLSEVVLVGHDLGGGVAQIVAARYPELCRGIFLIDSICYDSWPIPAIKLVRSGGAAVERFPDTAVKLMLETLLIRGHDNRRMAREAAVVHLRHYHGPGAAAALVRQARSLDQNETLAVADRLPHLRIPARVAWGSSDPFQKPHFGKRLAHDLGTEVQWLAGGKHFTPEDRPDELAEALNDLLRETEEEVGHVL